MLLPNALQIEYLPLKLVKDYHRQLRIPSKKQIEKAERMLRECSFMLPVAIDGNNCVMTGVYLVAAARRLGMEEIPVVRIAHLSEGQIQLLRHAHDRIAEEATWDYAAVAEDLRELMAKVPDIDLTLSGFDPAELDIMLDPLPAQDPADDIPHLRSGPSVVQAGDLYFLGGHRLYCGDALSAESYTALMAGEKAQVCFTDAPYNVKIDGHVGNSGKIKHPEFLQGVGEFDFDGFVNFLHTSHKLMAEHAEDGAIIYTCMDWRHLQEILTAGQRAGLALLNICVWVKDNGGMGSLYRSRHEFVLVFKNGKDRHINNVELGKHGRNRTNVWEYPGVNSFGSGRMDELKLHPTVKPLAMVADALKDCSTRGGIVLDPFGGSGTTLIAAEKTGRKARLIELDPHYGDVIICRWQDLTGKDAVHAVTGRTFAATQIAGDGHEPK